jgi:hypothetical protein
MRNVLIVALLVASAGTAGAREATVLTGAREISDSRHELSAHVGYQAGFGGELGSPSGIKVSADYAFRFHRFTWFHLQVSNTFGFGSKDALCAGSLDSYCYRGGSDFGIAAGGRFKFRVRQLPLLIEIPLLAGINVLYNRHCGDDGASFPVIRPGLRATYYVTPKIGLGAAVDLAVGPAFHTGSTSGCRQESYNGVYGSASFMLGAEFLL